MPAPIKQTCPDIDRIIKWVTAAMNETEFGEKCIDINDAQATFKEIYRLIEDVECELEQLRGANSALRNWGEECEEKIKNLELIIDDLETQLQDI